MRRLDPAAAMMTDDCVVISQRLLLFGRRRLGRKYGCNATTPPLLFWVRKNHPSCYSLQYTCNGNFDCRAHILATAFYHDHRAIIQVAYPLAQFFTILNDLDNYIFSRQQDRLDRVGKFVNIEHFYTLQFCHTVQIKVVRDDWTM